MFDAVAYAFNGPELDAFTRDGDKRSKKYYLMLREIVLEVAA